VRHPCRAALAMACSAMLVVPDVARAAAAAPSATVTDAAPPAPAARDDAPLNVVAARLQVMDQLIDFGRPPEEARRIAAALTADDLAVLAANPAMMQAAGEANAQMTSLIIAGLVIGGLVVLLIAADSGFAVQ